MGLNQVLTVALVLLAGLPGRAPAQAIEHGSPGMGRAFDRAVLRVRNNSLLFNRVSRSFDRDSFDLSVAMGLHKAADSTVLGWFTGFAAYINSVEPGSCASLTKAEFSSTLFSSMASTFDSAATEQWVSQWERAVVAHYVNPEPAPADSMELFVAMMVLVAELPGAEVTFGTTPAKPKKRNPAQECTTMRELFSRALRMEEPARLMVLRGLASAMPNRKRDSTE
jgi:hypothetical protein